MELTVTQQDTYITMQFPEAFAAQAKSFQRWCLSVLSIDCLAYAAAFLSVALFVSLTALSKSRRKLKPANALCEASPPYHEVTQRVIVCLHMLQAACTHVTKETVLTWLEGVTTASVEEIAEGVKATKQLPNLAEILQELQNDFEIATKAGKYFAL